MTNTFCKHLMTNVSYKTRSSLHDLNIGQADFLENFLEPTLPSFSSPTWFLFQYVLKCNLRTWIHLEEVISLKSDRQSMPTWNPGPLLQILHLLRLSLCSALFTWSKVFIITVTDNLFLIKAEDKALCWALDPKKIRTEADSKYDLQTTKDEQRGVALYF